MGVEFTVGAPESDGSRGLTVGGQTTWDPKHHGGQYANPVPGTNVTTLFKGETLDVRVMVDRAIYEVYVLGGRVAWVHAPQNCQSPTDFGCIPMNQTSVHIFN